MKKKINPKPKVRKHFSGKVSKSLMIATRDQAKITCKILEYNELQGIEAEFAGELTDKFAYEFEQEIQGKIVIIRGIRAVGAREAIRFAKKPYNFIPKFTYEKEDLGEGWFREVISCKNPNTGEITRSTCQWKRGDRFGDRIAATIGERNALLKQLPAEMKLQFINYCVQEGYIKKVNVDPAIEENKKAIDVLSDGNAAEDKAGKEKTAALARIYAVIGSMKVDKAKVRAWLHKSYKVASLKDLDLETLKKISCGLADIYGNAPGRCAKPKSNIMLLDEFVSMIEALKLNDKGEILK